MRRLFLWCLLTVFASVAHANEDDMVTGSQFASIYSYEEYQLGGFSCRDLTRSHNYLVNDGKALISEDKLFFLFAVKYIDGVAKWIIDEAPSVKGLVQTDEIKYALTENLIIKTLGGCYKPNRMDANYLESLLDVIAEGFDENDFNSKPYTKDFSCSDYAESVGLAVPILLKNGDVTLRVQDGISALKLLAFIEGYTSFYQTENAAIFKVYDKCKQYKNNISFMEALNEIRIEAKK